MAKKVMNRERLFDRNLIFTGDSSEILKDYPSRSKGLEQFAREGVNPKDLDFKFVKDGHMYLLRGGKKGQETGFYSKEYSKGNTLESLGLDPNNVAYAQSLNGNTPFISATTDLYTAAAFSQREKIYVLRVSVEDVYTFYTFEELMEKEYMVPDFISEDEIVRSFRYDKFKQLYNFLTNEVGLDIVPEDLGITAEDIDEPDIDRVERIMSFNEKGFESFDTMLDMIKDAVMSGELEGQGSGKTFLKK